LIQNSKTFGTHYQSPLGAVRSSAIGTNFPPQEQRKSVGTFGCECRRKEFLHGTNATKARRSF